MTFPWDWQFAVVSLAALVAVVVLVRTLVGCAEDGSCADCTCPPQRGSGPPQRGPGSLQGAASPDAPVLVQIGARRRGK